jgi:hypothetical protein
MPVGAPAFTPTSYIPLQVVIFTSIYTMEVNNSFGRFRNLREGQVPFL